MSLWSWLLLASYAFLFPTRSEDGEKVPLHLRRRRRSKIFVPSTLEFTDHLAESTPPRSPSVKRLHRFEGTPTKRPRDEAYSPQSPASPPLTPSPRHIPSCYESQEDDIPIPESEKSASHWWQKYLSSSWMLKKLGKSLENLFLYHPRTYKDEWHLGPFRELKAKELQDCLEKRYGLHLSSLPMTLTGDDAREGHTAFVVTPKSTKLSSVDVWVVLLPGNTMLALDWVDFVAVARRWLGSRPRHLSPGIRAETVGFLLPEYPGYGFSGGAPSQEAITKSIVTALETLHAHVQKSHPKPSGSASEGLGALKVRILGHSLGGAAAIQCLRRIARSTRITVQRVVLSSSFTSVADVAKSIFKIFPAGLMRSLISDIWDSRETLRTIAFNGSASAPELVLVHGSEDSLVPPVMSEELASAAASNSKVSKWFFVRLLSVPGKGHNDVLPHNSSHESVEIFMRALFSRRQCPAE